MWSVDKFCMLSFARFFAAFSWTISSNFQQKSLTSSNFVNMRSVYLWFCYILTIYFSGFTVFSLSLVQGNYFIFIFALESWISKLKLKTEKKIVFSFTEVLKSLIFCYFIFLLFFNNSDNISYSDNISRQYS